jgi:hypothetical protein
VASTGRWWRAADLAVLAGLVVLGSLLLVPAYGSAAPVVAAAVGAGVPAVVFAVLQRWSLPGALAVPLIPLGVMLLGALVVAPRDRVLGVLPSADAVAVLVRGSVDGWRDLLTVATPTGVTGSLLVPPLLIAAVGATAAGVLVGTRRPATALAGPAATTVAFAIFGDVVVDPWTVVVVGAGLLVAGLSWVVWIGGRAARRAERAAAGQLAQVVDNLRLPLADGAALRAALVRRIRKRRQAGRVLLLVIRHDKHILDQRPALVVARDSHAGAVGPQPDNGPVELRINSGQVQRFGQTLAQQAHRPQLVGPPLHLVEQGRTVQRACCRVGDAFQQAQLVGLDRQPRAHGQQAAHLAVGSHGHCRQRAVTARKIEPLQLGRVQLGRRQRFRLRQRLQ